MGRFDIATNKVPPEPALSDQERVVREIPRARALSDYGEQDPPEVSRGNESRFFVFQAPNGIRVLAPVDSSFSVQRNGNVLEIRGLSEHAMRSIMQQHDEAQGTRNHEPLGGNFPDVGYRPAGRFQSGRGVR